MAKQARGMAAKTERRTAIVDAARRMFAQATYEQTTMGDIAAAVGLAKGTLYLYFRTKENLFLEVVAVEEAQCLEEIEVGLRELLAAPGSPLVTTVGDLIACAFSSRPTLVRLLELFSSIIETGADHELVEEVMCRVTERFAVSGGLLEQLFPSLPAGEGRRLVVWVHMLVLGFGKMLEPGGMTPPVCDAVGTPLLEMQFAPELRDSLAALIHGRVALTAME